MRDLELIRRSPAVSGDRRRSPGIAADPADPPDQVSESAAQTLPSTRAGGQDDGSYTNSLKQRSAGTVHTGSIRGGATVPQSHRATAATATATTTATATATATAWR